MLLTLTKKKLRGSSRKKTLFELKFHLYILSEDIAVALFTVNNTFFFQLYRSCSIEINYNAIATETEE